MNQRTIKVTFMPDNRTVSVRPKLTLLDAGRQAGAGIRTRCGGRAGCLMCKVHVEDQSGLTAPAKNECLKLGDLIQSGTRLACQARLTGDTTVQVPEDPLKAAVRAQLARQKEEDNW
ncbi:2Fe-2S iron-sulfur cluster-binding protein [Paenibacillus sp. FJAT-26967]|uniref:2Fe-2S iron-sulfur cluster-binding protein n=1 Tax=Paenibacillus sp. FJAT-26967 TaxID=1729690 RepID=UPI0008388A67|nr:2Fe-2S iron-sulfur cluster-binding protein [Paenibacillus sp. FJAT-26967]